MNWKPGVGASAPRSSAAASSSIEARANPCRSGGIPSISASTYTEGPTAAEPGTSLSQSTSRSVGTRRDLLRRCLVLAQQIGGMELLGMLLQVGRGALVGHPPVLDHIRAIRDAECDVH